MRNFINEAIFGKPIGQDNFFADFMDWWNSLAPIYRYAILGSASAIVILILLALFLPSRKPKAEEIKGLEELVRLRMLKELAE